MISLRTGRSSAVTLHTEAAPLARAPERHHSFRRAVSNAQSRPRVAHRCNRASRVKCQASGDVRGGANDLNVNGKPPTSPAAWKAMQEVLKAKEVKCLAPQEVVPAQERGIMVLDIRPKKEYDEYHIPDSVNVQFYREIAGWNGRQTARRLAYAFFGVFNGTEYNPNFVEEVKELVDPEKGAILVCSRGGLLRSPEEDPEDDPNTLTGTSKTQTRSLMAAYELATAGFDHLSTLRGGFNAWIDQGREVSSNVHEMNDDGEWIS